MSAYIDSLNAAVAAERAQHEEKKRAAAGAVRERLTPLEDRLARLLATIPIEVQRDGLSLASLQASLWGRWRGASSDWRCAAAALVRQLRISRFVVSGQLT